MIPFENALVVFARSPRPGRVKTRLVGAFTSEEACEIHLALVGDVVERTARAMTGVAAVSLAWSEALEASAPAVALPTGVAVEIQPGGDLGERMAMAIQAKLRAGFHRVIVLGSDSPTLPADRLVSAFEALRSTEVVLGPAADGGYYLIGMSRLHLEVFRNVAWGTRDVLAVTKKRLKQAGARFIEMGAWYDVDTPEDLARLWTELLHMKERKAPDLPRRSFHLLARLGPGRVAR